MEGACISFHSSSELCMLFVVRSSSKALLIIPYLLQVSVLGGLGPCTKNSTRCAGYRVR